MMMLMLMFQIKLIFECIKIIDLLDLLKKTILEFGFLLLMWWCGVQVLFFFFFFAWLVHYYDQGWIWSGEALAPLWMFQKSLLNL